MHLPSKESELCLGAAGVHLDVPPPGLAQVSPPQAGGLGRVSLARLWWPALWSHTTPAVAVRYFLGVLNISVVGFGSCSLPW